MSEPVAVIDVDIHLTEPADLWTSRLAGKYADQAPHLVWDEQRRRHRWDPQARLKVMDSHGIHARKVLHDNAARIYHLDA